MEGFLAMLAKGPPKTQTQMRTLILQEHYTRCKTFTDEAFDAARNMQPDELFPQEFWRKYIVDPDWPADPSVCLDNEIHPLFTEDKWIMPPNLPMDRISEYMTPALQLVTKFITNERVLEWFTHVYHADRIEHPGDVPSLLVPKPGAMTRANLNVVRAELVRLSERLRFGWADDPSSNGLYFHDLQVLARTLFKEKESSVSRTNDPSSKLYTPTICISTKPLMHALRYSQPAANPAAKRVVQFSLANVVLHELAHAWTWFIYRDRCKMDEPIFFPGEAFPEAGHSLENFLWGSLLGTFPHGPNEQALAARSDASIYCDPQHFLAAYVPERWVNQWFLKSTWHNFSILHAQGEMFAPTPAKSVEHCFIQRFCVAYKMWYVHVLVKGLEYQPDRPCCKDSACKACNGLGFATPYPSDPKQFLQVYLEVVEADRVIALGMGCVHPNVKNNPFAAQKKRMEAFNKVTGAQKDVVAERSKSA